jgi:alkanesulfonate monooxygenase SsuD/methylene tetrahydromethanopterin reductase-like flavin-dependent oxidoreductase (luciferase family)
MRMAPPPQSARPPLLFGANVDPLVNAPAAAVGHAKLAEELGFDLVLIQDHPYNPAHLDTWTTLTVIAARTARIRVGSNVSPLPLRPPAMLAKQVASVAALCGGSERVLLGLGAGGFLQGVNAFGGPPLEPGESVDALTEGIQIIRALWSATGPVSFLGDYGHHRLRGVRFGPTPAGSIPIWIGGMKPRMLRLTGRYADGLIVSAGYVPPATLPQVNALVDRAAAAARRPASAVRRAYNVMGRILDPGQASEGDAVVGAGGAHDVATWVAALTSYATAGRIDAFVFWPVVDDPAHFGDQLRRFATEVAPAVRAAVAP